MDILYYLLLLMIIFSFVVQFKVSSTFKKYSHLSVGRGRTADEVARRILDAHGLYSVRIERTRGHLTDHYDPRARALRLSEGVFGSSSASAVGVAAHEALHAVQHAESYAPIVIRGKLVPAVNFASRFSFIAILLGILISAGSVVIGEYFLLVGIVLFGVTTLFHLVTLPCETNASRRALSELEIIGGYTKEELYGAKKVLSAAALTYFTAFFISLLQLLRYIRIFKNR